MHIVSYLAGAIAVVAGVLVAWPPGKPLVRLLIAASTLGVAILLIEFTAPDADEGIAGAIAVYPFIGSSLTSILITGIWQSRRAKKRRKSTQRARKR